MPIDSILGEGPLLGLQTAAFFFLLYPHMVEREVQPLPLIIRTLIPSWGPHLLDLI